MHRPIKQILTIIAALGLATSAYSLTIIPTFSTSILTNANVAAITNAINAGNRILQSNLTDNVTVRITFEGDESIGLGQSSTYGGDYSYASFLTALRSRAASVSDTNALKTLTNNSVDPVIGGTQIHLTTAQARLLGLDSYAGTDSTVSLKMSLMNFTRPPGNSSKYDLQQVVEHEVNEVLGISSGLPDTSIVWPVDLFRYTTNRVRTFTTAGDNAYFSVDGTNLLARYNMDSGGDYGDWWSTFYPTNWSPVTGVTLNYPQVSDAFSGPNTAKDNGVAEWTSLDVVGWTLAVAAAQTPPIVKIVRSGANQYTLSWTNTATGYVLQERTNLIAGSWAFSTTGATNPAVLLTATSQKFYRLYKPVPASQAPAPVSANAPAPRSSYDITTRSLQPRPY